MEKATGRALVPTELKGLRPAGAYTFDELYRFAQMCHASGLFEDVTDAAQAMIKIVKGQELGLPPTTAMAGFDLIKKRLFIKPWVIAAQINACGYGSYRVTVQTAEVCSILFQRKYRGEGWRDCPLVSYTWAEAKGQSLVDRSAHWKASPGHMLYQRCMGRGGAMYFPELLAGLQTPQDDAPIPPERHAQNIIDLFGDPEGRSVDIHAEPVQEVMTWRESIKKYLIDDDRLHVVIPESLYEDCLTAYHDSAVSHDVGSRLEADLMEWVEDRIES